MSEAVLANRDIGAALRARLARWGYGRVVGVILLCGVGCALALLLLGPPEDPARQEASAAVLAVSVASPRTQMWGDALIASGAVAPWQEASIGTQIGGYEIREVRVNVGDQVRKGQVLAVLNPALLQAEEAELIAAQDQAQANRTRAQALKASGAISDQDVLQAETTARTVAAQVAAKRLQLRYAIVRAPDDGVISARPATLGAVAPVGQELFRLIRGNRLEWRGELTAAQLAGTKRGQAVSLALPDGSTITATVRQVAPMLDDRSRLGIVYADIPKGSAARAGMYATGRIRTGQSQAQTVPAASIVVRDGRSFVMTVTGSSRTARIVQKSVTVGRRQGRAVEITHGLTAQDRVVTTSADFLNDGDVVTIVSPGAGAGARAGTRP